MAMRACVRRTSGIGRRELARDPHLDRRLFEPPAAGQHARELEVDPGVLRGEGRRLGEGRERGLALTVREQRATEQKRVGRQIPEDPLRPPGRRERKAGQQGGKSHAEHRGIIAGLALFPPAPI